MRYSTRKKLVKHSLWIALALIILFINIWVFFIVKPVTRLEKDLIELDVSIYSRIYPYDEGLMVIDQRELISLDLKGDELFRVELPEFDMQAYRNGNVTVVWTSKIAQIYNRKGQMVLEKPMQSDVVEILFGRTGKSYFVLATIEEGQYKARIFDYEAKYVDDMLFPSQSMLDLGFFGDSGDQLWALLLDSHGTIPITKIRTDHPGKSMTGAITILNQVCYEIVPREDIVYIVGTHHIESYSYTSIQQSEQLIFGWTMQDYSVIEDEVSFLMGTSQSSEYQSPISALWYIGSDNDQFRLSMPTGIMSAALSHDYIYAISKEGIYVYQIGKTSKSFEKISFEIKEVSALVEGKAIIIKSEEHFYMLPME